MEVIQHECQIEEKSLKCSQTAHWLHSKLYSLQAVESFNEMHFIFRLLNHKSVHNNDMGAPQFNTYFRIYDSFSDLFQPFFIAAFAFSLVTICGTMLMFQTELVEY